MFPVFSILIFIISCNGAISIPHAAKDNNKETVGRDGKTIKQIHISAVEENKYNFKNIECPYPYVAIGEFCLYAYCDGATGYTWGQGNAYCGALKHGSQAVFETPCELADIMLYLANIGNSALCNYWVGGSYNTTSQTWMWVNGELMPGGVPFWDWSSSAPSQVQPVSSTLTTQKYAQLSPTSNFRLINVADATTSTLPNVPLCQFNPKRINIENSLKLIPSYYLSPLYLKQ